MLGSTGNVYAPSITSIIHASDLECQDGFQEGFDNGCQDQGGDF